MDIHFRTSDCQTLFIPPYPSVTQRPDSPAAMERSGIAVRCSALLAVKFQVTFFKSTYNETFCFNWCFHYSIPSVYGFAANARLHRCRRQASGAATTTGIHRAPKVAPRLGPRQRHPCGRRCWVATAKLFTLFITCRA